MNKFLLAIFGVSFVLAVNEAKASSEVLHTSPLPTQDQAVLVEMEGVNIPDGFKSKKHKKKVYGVRKQPKFRSCKSARKIMKKRGNW
ncbi:MAG: hypothetical protein IT284_00800 [Bacteroidetes bacterium]|nr:hypothetical protein [Bacteroidota bacterium]